MDPSLKMALVMNKGKKTAHFESWSKTGKLLASFIQILNLDKCDKRRDKRQVLHHGGGAVAPADNDEE